MMRGVFILWVLICLSCKSAHPITENVHTDLTTQTASSSYFSSISILADSLSWPDLADPSLEKFKEEIRVVIESGSGPDYLLRLQKGRKTRGEVYLFWEKAEDSNTLEPQANLNLYLNGTCDEFRETPQFQYCVPIMISEVDWGALYEQFENRNIWSMTGNETRNSTEDHWQIHVELRHKTLYRSYSFTEPEKNREAVNALDILAVAAQVRSISQILHAADNFNVYQGVTSGKRGSAFTLCDESEVWRFNGDLETLISNSGYPAKVEYSDSALFYVNIQGLVKDEWYDQRGSSGFTKIITPSEINNFSLLNKAKCPNYE